MIPLKRFGQNFLIDKNILSEIISRSNLSDNDCVLEIGTGHGVLTRAILDKNIKFLHSMELDKRLKNELDELQSNYNNLNIIWNDAVKFDYETLSPFPAKVVANIPYNITTPLIWKLLKFSGMGLRYFLLMLQKESALRITASPDTKQRYPLGVAIEAMGKAVIVKNVSRKSFRPVPDVDSAIVEIVIDKNFELGNDSSWSEILHAGFSQRRKTLINNLKKFNPDISRLKNIFAEININENIRAEDLSTDEWLKVFYSLRPRLS